MASLTTYLVGTTILLTVPPSIALIWTVVARIWSYRNRPYGFVYSIKHGFHGPASYALLVLSLVGMVLQIIIRADVTLLAWTASIVVLACQCSRTAPLSLLGIHVGILLVKLWDIFLRGMNDLKDIDRAPIDWNADLIGQLAIISSGGILSLISIVIILNIPLSDPSPSEKATISTGNEVPTQTLSSPEDDITLWQWMTVSWLSSLLDLARKRQLHEADVWALPAEFRHAPLHEMFRKTRGFVQRRILTANWFDLFLLALLAITQTVASFAAPLLLKLLLDALEDPKQNAYAPTVYSVGILAARLVVAQCGVFNTWFMRRGYERSRGVMVAMLFEKMLNRKVVGAPDIVPEEAPKCPSSWWQSIKNVFKKPTKAVASGKSASTGKVINLIWDGYQLSMTYFWMFQTWIRMPLSFVVAIAFIWRLIGWPVLGSLAVLFAAQLLMYVLGTIQRSFQHASRKATDDRVQRTTEFTEAIRHLRWYGWERTWMKRVIHSRKTELNIWAIKRFWQCTIVLVDELSANLLPLATFFAYTVLAGRHLRLGAAFSLLELFELLDQSFSQFPNLVNSLLAAFVAAERIDAFLAEPDKLVDSTRESGGHIELQHVSLAWPGHVKSVLRDTSIKFAPGLNVVHGRVGAGKSALLLGVLGELDVVHGRIIKPTDGPIAYCAQSPWLQSMSIQENILFGNEYDAERYNLTLDACALRPDLDLLEHGDRSMIGERGIGLSGGQKARVALARAVYSQAQVLLLDDPISALDQQTATHVVNKCFGGELAVGRTIILVKHRRDA